MKLRRTLVTVAATAAIAPAALLSASTASAGTALPTAGTSATASPSASTSPSTTPSNTSSPTASGTVSTKPTASTSTPAQPTTSGSPTDEPTDGPGLCADKPGYQEKVTTTLTGLPGKIVAGSGWHNLTLTTTNNSAKDVSALVFYAGVGPASQNAPDAFSTKQVVLQAYDEQGGTWQNINDGAGHSVGFAGFSDTLKAGEKIAIKLRLDVKATAPISKGMTIGGGVYANDQDHCLGDSGHAYLVQIVGPGTTTDGTVPQTGGKVPLPTTPPNKSTLPHVTGNLAETGSSSATPVIAGVGAATAAVGAGAIFIVRRRKTSTAA
ncbi:LAETG motif-containing sortase-dependent surface protein [Streptomyces sp. H10-C2]|uniref:LAETG motif-containing sortase-dependent surface protein n=1 Tax=unclassified Streptomyces TaxID=2593676 RepID=UPI0024BB6696|nr:MULTISPECIES: LAETG motif-containing sortase-dependent surface protein [unclassified Streptomyces]MDJ0341053.1 LAETG motif-containing sortase-dependent surface protein [Streptomyces sp. PH10-H1]MDJ0369715.1 LAETG motif-containing sortase-dependent surface protein [Streptomyces sp. H10-C2]